MNASSSGRPSSATSTPQSRHRHGLEELGYRIWYTDPHYELSPDYVTDHIPELDDALDQRRQVALDYAAREHGRNKLTARRMQVLYVLLQATALLSAAAATVL
jgi:hypothetical protein